MGTARVQPSNAASAGVRAFLNVLVRRAGEVVETSADAEVRRMGPSLFTVAKTGFEVSDPYPDLATLFAGEGRTLFAGEGGRILEWNGWVLSEDCHGAVAGPHVGFDEWVWCEAETVWRGAAPGWADLGAPDRFVHAWSGYHFITIDPFPTAPLAFDSLQGALAAFPALPVLDRRLHRG